MMNPWGEVIVMGLIALCFTAIGFLAGRYETGKDVCTAKGGMYVKASEGWICIKGEKL